MKFYEEQFEAFRKSRHAVDMSDVRDRFLAHVPGRLRILDLGAGTGRDSEAFRDAGHAVTALDPSPKMVRELRGIRGIRVVRGCAEEMRFRAEFDAVWACASLLHVPYGGLPAALARVRAALKDRGVLYASFKHGGSDRVAADGRRFTDMDEVRLASVLSRVPGLVVVESWLSPSKVSDERFFNAVLRKEPERIADRRG